MRVLYYFVHCPACYAALFSVLRFCTRGVGGLPLRCLRSARERVIPYRLALLARPIQDKCGCHTNGVYVCR
jgi:hypothetical protein